jgi:hypothetical protein
MWAVVYEVRVIGKHDLPKGQDWMLVEIGARTTLLVKEGKLDAALLAEVWAAGRKLRRPPSGRVPRQRPTLRLAN